MENPTKTELETQEGKEDFLTREEILNLNPDKLAEYLNNLDEQGKLPEYLQEALQDNSLMAYLSYWEKWYTPEQQAMIDHIAFENFKKGINDWELPLGLEKRFTEEELEIIFREMVACQMTFGCSKGCRYCGFDAPPRVRDDYITYKQIKASLEKYGEEMLNTYFQHSSEPSDYHDKKEDKDIKDVVELIKEHAKYLPFISSRELKDEEWLSYIKTYPREGARLSLADIENPQETVDRVGANKTRGKGFNYLRGLGVSRKNLGIKREEEKDYFGISSNDWGLLLTPRGIYNTFPMPISDQFPQAMAVIPLEDLTDDEPIRDQSIFDFIRHKAMGAKAMGTDVFDEVEEWLVKERIEDKHNNPPYCRLAFGPTKKWIIQYDIDGKIISYFEPGRDSLNDLGFNLRASADRFVWLNMKQAGVKKEERLSGGEVRILKHYLLKTRFPEETKKRVEEDFVSWVIEVPKIGKVIIAQHDRQNGQERKDRVVFIYIRKILPDFQTVIPS